jgi:hypothetical protein
VSLSKGKWLLGGVLSCLPFFGTAFAVEAVQPEQFAKVHGLIKPKPGDEKWQQIPWLSSLWEARKQAAAAGKPILLWEMDGHPLGCT